MLGFAPAADALEIDVAGRPLWVDLRSRAARDRAHWALFWRLRPLPPEIVESVLASLAQQLQSPAGDRDTHRWMTADELRLLSGSPGVDMAAHTLTHPLLASMPPERQRREIEGSRQLLEQLLGAAPTLFSYPHGSADAFSDVTVQLVRDAGYQIGCTAIGGIRRAGSDVPRPQKRRWRLGGGTIRSVAGRLDGSAVGRDDTGWMLSRS